MTLVDTNPSPALPQFVCWSVAIPVELLILSTSLSTYTSAHHEPSVGDPEGGPLRRNITPWESGEVASMSVRILLLSVLVVLYASKSFPNKIRSKKGHVNGVTESTGLLDPSAAENGTVNGNGHAYGATNGSTRRPDSAKPDPWVRPTTMPSTSWWEYLSGYSLFFPYLWPSKSRRLQIVVLLCFVILILQRIVNLVVPLSVEKVTSSLSADQGQFRVPWFPIFCYVAFRWFQGGQGILSSLRTQMWIPVSQYSYMELSTAAFEHVHGLSLDFHLGKKTGEVMSALNKGNSINTFLEQVTFQVVPMLIDLCIAVAYFFIKFDVYYALVVGISTFGYLYVTIRMAQWRAEIRREMVNASRQEDAVK